MTFRPLIIFFCLLKGFVFCPQFVAIIGIAQVLGCPLRMVRRAIMTLVVQFTGVACLRNLVILHRLVHLTPCLTESVA